MSGHFIEKCIICGIVISQCQCPSKDKEIRYSLCKSCKDNDKSEMDKEEVVLCDGGEGQNG